MSQVRKTKPCVACDEVILAEAKLCKFCKSNQGDPGLISARLNFDSTNATPAVPSKKAQEPPIEIAEVPRIVNACVRCGALRDISGFGLCEGCSNEPALAPRQQIPGQSGVRPGAAAMLIGGSICLVGILITAGTYNAASDGGHFIVAWGAIVFGAIQFFRGLAEWSRSS